MNSSPKDVEDDDEEADTACNRRWMNIYTNVVNTISNGAPIKRGIVAKDDEDEKSDF